jgi:precorrin-6Y C5,15-methyltransferase (decarboxylating)
MFFGIGERLVDALGSENVTILPNISSVAAAFARIKEPWNDVRVVSLHGRKNESRLFKALENENKVAVFTDSLNTPQRIAARLIEKDFVNFEICVLERLGNAAERYQWYPLPRAAGMNFLEPNLVILKRRAMHPMPTAKLCLGAPDNWYDHPAGLITKAEVRALALAKLRLAPGHIFWDLGAGSGSIAIEAALFVKRGKIFAVEQDPARIEQIQNNQHRFGVRNLKIIQTVMPAGLSDLPHPDRIFIGGGGKNLKKIIETAAQSLKPDGIIVINAVLIPNVQIAVTTLRKLGFETDVIQIQVHRGREMPWGDRLEAQNPVWIISGIRKVEVGRRKREGGKDGRR